MSQVVYFKPQQTTAFAQLPYVVVTVLGTLPYATPVSDIDTTEFKWIPAAVFTPAEDNIAPTTMQRLAYV